MEVYSRVRTRDEITLGIWAQGWSGGGWLLDDKHTEAHICAHNRVQKDMMQNNTSICVLSSFRLSVLVCNHADLGSHINTMTLSHPVKDLCTQQWLMAHLEHPFQGLTDKASVSHKYRLMPFSAKGLGSITSLGAGRGAYDLAQTSAESGKCKWHHINVWCSD